MYVQFTARLQQAAPPAQSIDHGQVGDARQHEVS